MIRRGDRVGLGGGAYDDLLRHEARHEVSGRVVVAKAGRRKHRSDARSRAKITTQIAALGLPLPGSAKFIPSALLFRSDQAFFGDLQDLFIKVGEVLPGHCADRHRESMPCAITANLKCSNAS